METTRRGGAEDRAGEGSSGQIMKVLICHAQELSVSFGLGAARSHQSIFSEESPTQSHPVERAPWLLCILYIGESRGVAWRQFGDLGRKLRTKVVTVGMDR